MITAFLPICTNKPCDLTRHLHILFYPDLIVLLFKKRIINVFHYNQDKIVQVYAHIFINLYLSIR